MTITADLVTTEDPVAAGRCLRIARRQIPVKGPSIRDPRIHLAFTILSIIAIGMVWLDFRLSIPQFALAFLSCGLFELVMVFRRTGALVWPASAFQTATSTALLLRVTGMEAHDWWAFDGWYYFVGIALAGLLTKYLIRYQGRHILNPANAGLVVAFLVLGAERVEPLDFWWAPLGWAMAAAYAVILIGGYTLGRRLSMNAMALSFLVTFAIGVGVLAALGQSITARWSLTPVSGLRYWWILVTSPETLIFLYFMITDPKTTPSGRRARILFGCAVGMASTLLLAPWPTEYGTKVGLLGGLVVLTLVRPFVRSWWDASETSPEAPMSRSGRFAAITAAVLFMPAAALAGLPNRNASEPEPAPPAVAIVVDPASIPTVSIDDDVAGLSAELASPSGAQALAAELMFNLRVEADAILHDDENLLVAVDHGQRLIDMQTHIAQAAGSDRVVPSYDFETLHLSIVYPGGFQSGANAGLTATGTVSLVTYSVSGEQLSATTEPIEIMFALRKTTSERWLITSTPSPTIDDNTASDDVASP